MYSAALQYVEYTTSVLFNRKESTSFCKHLSLFTLSHPHSDTHSLTLSSHITPPTHLSESCIVLHRYMTAFITSGSLMFSTWFLQITWPNTWHHITSHIITWSHVQNESLDNCFADLHFNVLLLEEVNERQELVLWEHGKSHDLQERIHSLSRKSYDGK